LHEVVHRLVALQPLSTTTANCCKVRTCLPLPPTRAPTQVLDKDGKVVPHVYCIGDANGKYMLAHAASAQVRAGRVQYVCMCASNITIMGSCPSERRPNSWRPGSLRRPELLVRTGTRNRGPKMSCSCNAASLQVLGAWLCVQTASQSRLAARV